MLTRVYSLTLRFSYKSTLLPYTTTIQPAESNPSREPLPYNWPARRKESIARYGYMNFAGF
jgi:hypothetical protein